MLARQLGILRRHDLRTKEGTPNVNEESSEDGNNFKLIDLFKQVVLQINN